MSASDSRDTTSPAAVPHAEESRVHHDLRLIFEGACRVTAPCFGAGLGMGGPSLATSARRMLRESYPELTQQEVSLLFSAVARFHQANRSD